ncbi:pyridoxal-phosphate dependent enzyme, partial [Staphylococcus aureus]
MINLFAAIGGGGLISGISTYFKTYSPTTKIIGVEPSGASSMYESVVVNNQVVTLPMKRRTKNAKAFHDKCENSIPSDNMKPLISVWLHKNETKYRNIT